MRDLYLATEQRSFDEILRQLPTSRRWVRTVMTRIESAAKIPRHAGVLEIGAAAGANVAMLSELGYRCQGLEPWDEARRNARRLAKHLDVPIHIVAGRGEDLPYLPESFDVVCAFAVLEHVSNLEKVLREVFRVLKAGGVFWFSSASSLSPLQNEIHGFPLFGWYPESLKRRIVYWAQRRRPDLIGHTSAPAVHWFTPRKARKLLYSVGFETVYDRWDLRGRDEGGWSYRTALQAIRSRRLAKLVADVIVPGCSYAAIKTK